MIIALLIFTGCIIFLTGLYIGLTAEPAPEYDVNRESGIKSAYDCYCCSNGYDN